jgi:hypothetical protein
MKASPDDLFKITRQSESPAKSGSFHKRPFAQVKRVRRGIAGNSRSKTSFRTVRKAQTFPDERSTKPNGADELSVPKNTI